jgi:glutamine cyclotransferase
MRRLTRSALAVALLAAGGALSAATFATTATPAASPSIGAPPAASGPAASGPAASPSIGAPPAASGPAASGPAASPVPIADLELEVLSRRPHDTRAWTQALLFDADGRLFESTGIVGRSQVRELDPDTGAVVRSRSVPGDLYGEGLALVDDRMLIQITWTDGQAVVYDKDSFEVLDTFRYAGEGWGLCSDGTRLIMSDGSDTLTFRDPTTFEVQGSVAVTAEGVPVTRINELECLDGEVWANVWETSVILRIDPASGAVTGILDATGLLADDPVADDVERWLNGIARIPGGDTWLLTGKLWPQAVEVRIHER